MFFDQKTWNGFIEGPLAAAAEQGHIMQMASFTIGRNKPIFYFFYRMRCSNGGRRKMPNKITSNDENAEQNNIK
jgi:hypothetical protein